MRGASANKANVLKLEKCLHSYKVSMTGAVCDLDPDIVVILDSDLIPVKERLKVQLSICGTD